MDVPRAQRGPKKREYAVARRLHDVTVITTDSVDHQVERGIDDRSRLFRVEALHKFHRAFDVGEQRGNIFSLTVDYLR